jgi:hypothetical protein
MKGTNMKKFIQTKQYLLRLIVVAALMATLSAALPGVPAQDGTTPQQSTQKGDNKVDATGDSEGTSNVLTTLNNVRLTPNDTVLTLKAIRLTPNDTVLTLKAIRPTPSDTVLRFKAVRPTPNDTTK